MTFKLEEHVSYKNKNKEKEKRKTNSIKIKKKIDIKNTDFNYLNNNHIIKIIEIDQ